MGGTSATKPKSNFEGNSALFRLRQGSPETKPKSNFEGIITEVGRFSEPPEPGGLLRPRSFRGR